eukprot:414657-Rhodomonas_salina.2
MLVLGPARGPANQDDGRGHGVECRASGSERNDPRQAQRLHSKYARQWRGCYPWSVSIEFVSALIPKTFAAHDTRSATHSARCM